MNQQELYRDAKENERHQSTLLFERLNYFLTGSAFLVTGYAALAVSIKHWTSSQPILLLAYLVNGAGLYLSIFFAIMGHLNTKILDVINIQIKTFELTDNKHAQRWENLSEVIEREVVKKEFHSNPYSLVCGPFIGFWSFVKKPLHMGTAPNTYMIPVGFLVFWLVVFFFIFPPHFLTLLFFFAPVILGFFIIDFWLIKKAYLKLLYFTGVALIVFAFFHSYLDFTRSEMDWISVIILVWIIALLIFGYKARSDEKYSIFDNSIKQLDSIFIELGQQRVNMPENFTYEYQNNEAQKAKYKNHTIALAQKHIKLTVNALKAANNGPTSYTLKQLENIANIFKSSGDRRRQ